MITMHAIATLARPTALQGSLIIHVRASSCLSGQPAPVQAAAIVALHGPLEQFSSATWTHAGITATARTKDRAKICLESSDWEEQLGPLLSCTVTSHNCGDRDRNRMDGSYFFLDEHGTPATMLDAYETTHQCLSYSKVMSLELC